MDVKLRTDIGDPNNNNNTVIDVNIIGTNKSYSLRPRSAVRSGICVIDDESTNDWKPRGRTKRRPKQKPPPLSKYRRKTANARERSRMREINEAFESLRRAVPQLTNDNSHNEKMTKITTLRLAMKYITALTRVLQDPDPESDLDSADYTLSLTPNSISDHSDLYDQFLLSDPSSTSSIASGFNPVIRTAGVTLDAFLPTQCYSLTPSDVTGSLIDIREHCLTPSDFHAEFDSIASSSVDLDDFFVS